MQNEVWCYDLRTGVMRRTGQKLRGGFWNGQAITRDRCTIYLSTVSGELYELDVRSGVFTHLGQFIDPLDVAGPDGLEVAYLYGISLGSNHRDRRGNIYAAAFDWNTNCKLAVLKPPYT